jgi:hypothetical protein
MTLDRHTLLVFLSPVIIIDNTEDVAIPLKEKLSKLNFGLTIRAGGINAIFGKLWQRTVNSSSSP